MTVVALKLISGDEVIGEVIHETDSFVSLKNALLVAIQQSPDGRTGLGFLPFMPYLGKEKIIKFEKARIVVQEEVDEQMKNQYNSVFGGIVVPPKQLITG
jgi:hypothetical protein